jgi:membrane protease YdiL (CAAX protease family)
MSETLLAWIVIIALTLILVAFMLLTRWFQRVVGPRRVDPDEPIAPWLSAVILGGFVWLGAQVVYVGYLQSQRQRDGAATATQTAFDFQPHEIAIAATVPPSLAAVTMFALAAGAPGWLTRIGLSSKRILPAMGLAVVAIVLAYPLVFWTLQAMEWTYRMVQFEHPREHELLQELSQNPAVAVRWAMLAAAIVVAPIFEELFFRGGIQTIGRWSFAKLAGRESPSTVWAAIVVASLLFAMIHTLWMTPAIFVLSLTLGYLYERTGNLWACIFMHAMFNAINTVFFLNQ